VNSYPVLVAQSLYLCRSYVLCTPGHSLTRYYAARFASPNEVEVEVVSEVDFEAWPNG
jgi:hypothetical protein